MTEHADLWVALKVAPEGPARLRLFELHLPFSRRVASHLRRQRAGADLDMGDLYQYAAEGLLQAIDRFDADRGSTFEGFARRRIAGCVIDGIGESSELRRQLSFRNRARTERLRSLSPGQARSGSSSDALQALGDLALELALGFMLDDAAASSGEAIDRSPSGYESAAWSDTVARVVAAVTGLPDPEGLIVRHHYLEGLEFARIADTLSLSRGRVSQIHSAALARLRKTLPRADLLYIQR